MIYKFRNTQTDEIVEVEMSMKDYTPYKGKSGEEDVWERVYETPQINMGVSTAKSLDPWSRNDFINRTKDMRGNYGDIMDHAKEMSEKRKSKRGYDHIGEAHEKKRQKEIDSRKPSNKKNKN